MDLFLIRHTTPDIPKGVCYGQADIGVKESFARERDRVQAMLHEESKQKLIPCYASPLQRCAKLAQGMDNFENIQFDARIKEMNFGDWEHTAWSDIDQDALNHWMEDYIGRRVPGGESYGDMIERVLDVFQLTQEAGHEQVAWVTHGGVIRAMVTHVLEMPSQNLYHFDLDFGSLTKIRITQGKTKLMYLNR